MDDFFQNLRVFLSNGDLIDKMFKRYKQIDDKKPRKEYNTDLYGGIIMVVSSVFFWSRIGNFTQFGIIFPRSIIILLFIAGIGLLIKAKVKPIYSTLFTEDDKFKLVGIGIISLVWVLLLDKIGFAVTSFLALGLSITLLNDDNNSKEVIKHFIIAAIEVGIFFIVFSRFLNVPLPGGILF